VRGAIDPRGRQWIAVNVAVVTEQAGGDDGQGTVFVGRVVVGDGNRLGVTGPMDGEPAIGRIRAGNWRRRQYQTALVEADLGEVERGGAKSRRRFDPELDVEQAASTGRTSLGEREGDGEHAGGTRVGNDRRALARGTGAGGDKFEQRGIVDEPEIGCFQPDGVVDQHRNGDDAAGGGAQVSRNVHVRVRSRRRDGDPGERRDLGPVDADHLLQDAGSVERADGAVGGDVGDQHRVGERVGGEAAVEPDSVP
jgi:hypothetical protein